VWLKHGEDSKILALGAEAKDHDELLRPLSYNAFWDLLKRKKGEGIRLTYLRHPHPCEMCETLPSYEAKLKEALLAKEREPDATKKSKLGKEVKRLQGLRDRRLAHRKTLDHQRAWINKNVIWELRPGQCLVQADFVSFYNTLGKKVHDLVLVIHYVTREGGPVQRLYVDNFFRGQHKSPQTTGILDYLLSSTSVFDQFTDITFSGDTGSGFRQDETLWYYSTLKAKYGKNISVDLLAPRHAFNMADSHGGRLAEIVAAEKAASEALLSPEEFCAAVRRSKLQHTVSFFHENPGNHELVPARGAVMQTGDDIMTLHSFRTTGTVGVLLASKRSGRRLRLYDLRTHEKRDRCQPCQVLYLRPTSAHAADERCPAEKESAEYIDSSVRPGMEAGVRKPPRVNEQDEEKRREKEEKKIAQAKAKKKEKAEEKVRKAEERVRKMKQKEAEELRKKEATAKKAGAKAMMAEEKLRAKKKTSGGEKEVEEKSTKKRARDDDVAHLRSRRKRVHVSYEDMEFEEWKESSGNEDLEEDEGEDSEEECRGNADSGEDEGVLSSSSSSASSSAPAALAQAAPTSSPAAGAVSPPPAAPSSAVSSAAVSPLEDNQYAVIDRPGSGLYLCQITDANPSEHPGNITVHYLNREKAHQRWHLGWRDPKDDMQIYQATSKQKRRAYGYVPVTEVVDPAVLVRHGFEMTRYGRLPEEVELLLEDTYLRNKQSS
jgi:hypothetical protein